MLGLVAAAAVIAVHELRLVKDGKLHIGIFPDTVLIRTPSGRRIVVDARSPQALEELGGALPFFSRGIDLLVLTHLTSSRLAAVPALIRRYPVGAILLQNLRGLGGGQQQLAAAMEERHVPFFAATQHQTLDMEDGVSLQTVTAQDAAAARTSFGLRVSRGGRSALILGDIGKRSERSFTQSNADMHATVLVDEDGAAASSTGFILAVAPAQVFLPSLQETAQLAAAAARYGYLGISAKPVTGDAHEELVW